MHDQIDALLARLAQLHDARLLCQQQYEEMRQCAIPPEVQAALTALSEACQPQINELTQAIEGVQAELKAAVLTYGHSVKGYGYHAVFSAGRVSWADDFLQGYAAVHPEILQARIEGKASVSIRKA